MTIARNAAHALVMVLLVMGNFFDMDADEPGSALFFWHSSLGVLVFIRLGAASRLPQRRFQRPFDLGFTW